MKAMTHLCNGVVLAKIEKCFTRNHGSFIDVQDICFDNVLRNIPVDPDNTIHLGQIVCVEITVRGAK